MKLLRFNRNALEPEELRTARVVLRAPSIDDYPAWADLRHRSAEFLKPFEPSWTSDELSRSAFRGRLRRHQSDLTSGRGLSWYLFNKDKPEQILGGIALSNIRRGVADTATMGYWMGQPFAGRGYMKEAVMAVCHSAFVDYRLHRVEAATILDNQRSQGLLTACGFQREGVARQYLKINGKWHDHMLFAKLANDK